VTGAQMVLVMKLTAFCWSVHDGRLQVDVSFFPRPWSYYEGGGR